jgi:hypothetical protein
MTKKELIEEVKEDMCDNYCKYPFEYLMQYEDPEDAHEKMLDEVCNDCPLTKYL